MFKKKFPKKIQNAIEKDIHKKNPSIIEDLRFTNQVVNQTNECFKEIQSELAEIKKLLEDGKTQNK